MTALSPVNVKKVKSTNIAIQMHRRNPDREPLALLIADMLVLFQKASHVFHSTLKGLATVVALLLKVLRRTLPSPILFVGTRYQFAR